MTKPSSGKSGTKTGSKAVRKIREFATSELFDVGTDMVAFMASHFAIDFIRKVPDVFKNAFGKLGKAAGENFEAGDLSKIISEVKAGLTSEKMPETYRLELERIIERQLQSASIILADGEMSASERIVALNNIKRNMQDEITILEQRYREEPFQIRIIPRLSEAHQEKLEQMAMTDAEEIEWQKLRDQIKSVEMFSRTLEHATNAKDLLKRLQRNLGTPKKQDPQEALSAKINESGRMLKQGLMAVDAFIKDLLPYEEIHLPNMKRKELWAEYWNSVISSTDVKALKLPPENDDAFKARVKASIDLVWPHVSNLSEVQAFKVAGDDDDAFKARVMTGIDLVWPHFVALPTVEAMRHTESDDDLKKRLMADKKFVAVMERKLQERNRRIK